MHVLPLDPHQTVTRYKAATVKTGWPCVRKGGQTTRQGRRPTPRIAGEAAPGPLQLPSPHCAHSLPYSSWRTTDTRTSLSPRSKVTPGCYGALALSAEQWSQSEPAAPHLHHRPLRHARVSPSSRAIALSYSPAVCDQYHAHLHHHPPRGPAITQSHSPALAPHCVGSLQVNTREF